MNLHTVYHGKDQESGRSPMIEGFIDKTLDFVASNVPPAVSMLDLGCDYGYASHSAIHRGITLFATSVELYGKDDPLGRDIVRESLEDPLLPRKLGHKDYDLLYLNHVLEHLYNPHAAMATFSQMAHPGSHFFIAVPDAGSPWATWDGHYSVWTADWLTAFMSLHGWTQVAAKQVDLRNGDTPFVELWGVFRRA